MFKRAPTSFNAVALVWVPCKIKQTNKQTSHSAGFLRKEHPRFGPDKLAIYFSSFVFSSKL